MNFIFPNASTIASASAQVMLFGRFFMSIPVRSWSSLIFLEDILDKLAVNILLKFLLSVVFAMWVISSAVTPLGWGNTSLGKTGTISAALLKMYLCPLGSLKVIFAWGLAIMVLRMYSNAPCSANEYDTSLKWSWIQTPVLSGVKCSVLMISPTLFFTSILNSILTPLSSPSSFHPEITWVDSPVVIWDKSTQPLQPKPCCPLDWMFLNLEPANIWQYTWVTNSSGIPGPLSECLKR